MAQPTHRRTMNVEQNIGVLCWDIDALAAHDSIETQIARFVRITGVHKHSELMDPVYNVTMSRARF